MAPASYAMFWRYDDGPRYAGRVEVGSSSLELESSAPPAAPERVAFAEIARVVLERGQLLLERVGLPELWIGSLDRPGALRELADRLVEATADAG